jgi:hypothetical protein
MGSQIKLSHFSTVFWNAQQYPDRLHARCQALPLHSLNQGFENAGICCWRVPL